jgi:hypothetical protein
MPVQVRRLTTKSKLVYRRKAPCVLQEICPRAQDCGRPAVNTLNPCISRWKGITEHDFFKEPTPEHEPYASRGLLDASSVDSMAPGCDHSGKNAHGLNLMVIEVRGHPQGAGIGPFKNRTRHEQRAR